MSGWTVIVPVKPWRLAKSRLRTMRRADLARAFTLDVLDALCSTKDIERIVMVSAESQLGVEARVRGIDMVVDRPLLSPDGLDIAVQLGRRWAMRTAPSSPLVVVPADLPCLTSAVLGETLRHLDVDGGAFVPDLARGGTTLVGASRPSLLRTSYGHGSAERHRALGMSREIAVPLAVRRDVDTLDDLAHARALGLGPHTSETSGLMPVASAHAV